MLSVGTENIPNVWSYAACCPSILVAAQQSSRVYTRYPFSYAVRMDDSTQQLVRKPARTTFWILFCRNKKSRFVEWNPQRPVFPLTMRSPGWGVISSQMAAPHSLARKHSPSLTPAKIPYGLLEIS